jgi:hypothetical protein
MNEALAPDELEEIMGKMARLDDLKDELINRLYQKIEEAERRANILQEFVTAPGLYDEPTVMDNLISEIHQRMSETLLETGLTLYEQNIIRLMKLARDLQGLYESAKRDVEAMQFFIEECDNLDAFLTPYDIARPSPTQEKWWNERGWTYDNIGFGWCPPGYHIAKPGKYQKNDY